MHKTIKRIISGIMSLMMLGELMIQNIDSGIFYEMPVFAESENSEVISENEVSDPVDTTDENVDPDYEDWTISSNQTLSGKKEVQNLTVSGGTLNLNGNTLIVHGNVEINGGDVRMNKGEIICENFTAKYRYSSFYMNNVNDHLVVNQNFTYNDGYMHDGRLTAGTIEIKGDFISNGSYFIPSSEHIVVLNGDRRQTIMQKNMNLKFCKLDIQNTSSEGVVSDRPITAEEIFGNLSKLHVLDQGISGYKLEEDQVINGNVYLTAGNLDLDGHTLTITGNLVQAGGKVMPNNGELNVGGNYYIASMKTDEEKGTTYDYSTGYLVMIKEKDRVNVGGDFVTMSTQDHRNMLKAGILKINGNFEQKRYDSEYNFCASGTHTVIFDGDCEHDVKFNSDYCYCYFQNLDIKGETIKNNNPIYVYGELKGEGCTTSGYVYITNLSQIENAQFSGKLCLNTSSTGDEVKLTQDMALGDFECNNLYLNGFKMSVNNISVNSEIKIQGGLLQVKSNFRIGEYGRLSMKDPEDYLWVSGNFTTDSKYSTEGNLTAGTIEIKGDFTQTRNVSFVTDDNCKVVFNGTNALNGRRIIQTIKFYNPEISCFHKLVITKPISEYRFLNNSGIAVDPSLFYEILSEEIIDTECPQQVTGFTAVGIHTTSIDLLWNESADNVGIMGYEIYRDGKKIFTTAKTEFTDYGLLPETEYTYEVYAFDECRNRSDASETILVTTLKDTEAPYVPQELHVQSKTGSSITLAWNPAQDNVETVGYYIYCDGENVAEVVNANSYKVTGLKTDVIYEFQVCAFDKAENVSEPSNTVIAKPQLPVIDSISPKEYSEIGGTSQDITIKFTNLGNSNSTQVKLEYKFPDDDDSLYQEVVGHQISRSVSASLVTVKYSWQISGLHGSYYLRVTLIDSEGNTTDQVTEYYIDSSAPTAPEKLAADSHNGQVELKWSTSVSINCSGYVIYRAENKNGKFEKLTTITNPLTARYVDTTADEKQTYLYRVSSYSKYGIESLPCEAVSITVSEDKEPPEIKSIRPGHSRISGKAIIMADASDNIALDHAVFEYKSADSEEWIEIGKPDFSGSTAKIEWDTEVISDGAYIIRVFAFDHNENISDAFTKAYIVDNTGPEKIVINADECSTASSFVSIRWKDITEPYFGYYVVEQLDDSGNYKEVGRTSTTAGMHIENLQANTVYTFCVVAYDDLNNRGIPSDPIELCTTSDTIQPGIRSFYPSAAAFSDSIDLSITASDNIAVSKMLLRYSQDSGDEKNWKYLAEIAADKAASTYTFNYLFDITSLNEGDLFIEADVYDSAENKSQSVTAQYIIDRTAPKAIVDLQAVGNNGNIHLTWSTENDDIQKYEIYRAEDEKTMYTKLADCQTRDYYDITAEFETTYTYQIYAIDAAGNRSNASNEAIAQAMQDVENPRVLGFNPASGSTVGVNPKMYVVASDNNRLSSITVSYQPASANDGIWNEIGIYKLKSNYQSADFVWETGELDDGDYRFKAVATDVSGNVSEAFIAEYTLKTSAPDAPVLELFQENWQLRLEWSKPKSEDFWAYQLYKKSETDSDFKAVGYTEKQVYTDSDITPGVTYSYKIRAYDQYGNYSESNVMKGFAYNEDTIAPIINLPKEMYALVGSEVMFDGTESTDNVRITHYMWNLGNDKSSQGSRVIAVYDDAGIYTVTLTVKDAAGNTSSSEIKLTVYDKTEYGSVELQVVDDKNNPIKYAYVYLYQDNGSSSYESSLKTDYNGNVTISGKLGTYQISVYKEGYLPVRTKIDINENGINNSQKVALSSGELVTGSLTVHRMTLEEMIEAGVDFNNPSNFHSYTFEFKLTFAQEPIPVVIEYVGGGGSGGFGGGGGLGWLGSGGGGYTTKLSDGSTVQIQPIIPDVEIEDGEELPVYLAYIKTSESISFMKEMYAVELGVMNHASSEFVITDCAASLSLPDGLSLASTTSGKNTIRQKMDNIAGQETKTASWVIRGDKKGEYNVSADFEGKLQPFNVPVRASFCTENPFEVGVGKGLNLYIYPEEIGYIGEDYYIQYELRNEGSDTFYNLKTSFHDLINPGYDPRITVITPDGKKEVLDTSEQYEASYVIENVNKCPLVPVTYGNQKLQIGMFSPGDALYGTYKTTFSGEGDPEEVRYRLIESLVTGLEETDIKVNVIPIPSHINKYNIQLKVAPMTWADPVDMTTGAFTDDIQALSVQGAFSQLSLDMHYNSLNCSEIGSVGYGWSHDYEAYLDFKGNVIDMHWNAANYASFVDSAAASYMVSGRIVNGNSIEIIGEDDGSTKEYQPINHGMQGYILRREEDGTYTLNELDGTKLRFDSTGKLTQIISPNEQTVSITRNGNTVTITEDMSGVHLILSYSGGVVTSVTDGNGRIAYMSYESGFLTSMTNAAGDIVNFAYDKNGRMISSTVMGEETPYVENVYDNNNRVVKQYDALGNVSKFSYAKDKNESLTVSATDRNGNNVVFTSDSMGRVCSIIDANYHETSYVYDIRGNLLSETNSKGDSRRYEYDADNNLIKLYDYYGNVTEMSYDSYGNVTEVDGSLGEHSSYTYNPHNLLASVAENSGIRNTYTYNKNNQILTESTTGLGVIYYEYENGRLVSLTDYNGNKKFLTYDDMGNLHSETDFNGNETVYEYDALGRVTGITTEDGVVSYIYDSRGNKTSATDANGNTIYMYYNGNNKVIRTVDAVNAETIFEYDNEDRLLKTTYADGTSDTNTYDAAGNLTRTVNANNEITEYEYDEVDQVVSVTTIDEKNKHTISYSYYPDGKLKCTTYADGSSETYTYDKAGRTTSITDQLGNTIVMAYDNSGNLISSSDAEGNTTKYTYDIYGRVLTAIDPNGNVTSYDKYDANGNCLQMTYPNGLIFSYEYDKNGQIIKAVTGDISVLYEYDASGRVKKYTDEENHVYTFSYDANGNVTQMTDANGNVIAENQYDAVNNLIMTTDALGIQTEYTYNNVGQLKKVIESINTARQAETIYNYDNIGQLTDVTDAENGTASYEYDGFGNIISMTDPNGGKTTYTYDSMGRILESLNAVGSKNSYTYNAQGLLDSAVNARGQETSYTYYKNGWIKSFADELGTVSYTYDSNGNVLTVKDDNGTITREYNEMNQVTKYTDFRGNTVSYGYDELGNLVTITYPGGRIVRYSYYKNGNIKTVTDWNNQITSYEYDGNGRLTKTSRPDGSVETRSYDAAGRLIKQVDAVGNKTINARDYSYDESGNIVSASMSNGTEFSGLTNAEMEYDEANRLIKYNGVDVEYDADGNMIYGPLNGVMTDLVYDCRNRLISAGGITYEYDAENNRISKTSSNTKTSYTVDTSGSLSRILTVEKDGKTIYYVYGIGLVSQEDDTRNLYYHFSNIGSTEAITDIDGNIVETFEYGPYGELTSENKCGIIFLYNGEYGVSADENGLYYMRARYYSPEIKRFINQDVVIGTIADSPSMNRYAYVQGNPISYVDPFGLSPGLGWKFWAHTGLSLLGGLMAIPTPVTMIIGAAATIINTAWYAAEGDYFSAICSGISVFGCGFQALSAAKAAGSLSISCKFITALKYASCVSEIAVATYDMVQIGNEMYNLAANGELTLGKVLGSTFNVVMDAVSIGNSVNMLSQKVSYCFVAGTLVETDEGQKPIEDIKVGDKVLSEDVETGEVAYKTVEETYINETDELIHVHINDEIISATPNHPFYVEKIGWTLAKNLRAGDTLVLSNGEFVVVEWVQHEILESPIKVYNFEVEDFHTYFVGDNCVLVHNKCPDSRLPSTQGQWEDEVGNSLWHSTNNDVLSVTKGEAIPYKNGRPDFSAWSKGTITFEEGVLTGKNQDFSLVYKAIQKEKGFATQAEAHQWLKQNNLTAHHFSSTQIQLIPSDLHNNLPHIGAASDLRKMGNNLKLKEIDKMFENYGILGISIG